ncbi:MAG: cyclic beta 1-2 glucan synthetase, partial [Proteobacteria bacterium]|nr:cyclic beta 1-2 glucan synthetase [Pseudomonadota bacterium]
MVQKIRYLKRIKQTIDSLVKNIKSINASPWRQHIPFFALNKEIEKQPLRLGLLSLDQLERHAKSLAAKHEITAGLGQESLLHRLAFNEKMMQVAYSRLNIAVLAKTEISPAGEWLLDNFVLIEEQIRTARRHLPKGYCRELPHLVNGPSAGYPRVYDIAMEVIAHVDGRVDKENISAFINAYQQIKLLKLGEFWAIPIMLRLALIENLSRIAANVVRSMDDREIANQWADQLLHYVEHDPGNLILVAADMARSQPPMSNSFVAELMRRLAGQGSSMDIPLAWIEQHLLERGQSTQQLVQREGQEQAASQVAVGASIGSLRFLGAIDWGEFVEAASLVEQHLRLDPAGIYEKMDFVTRDHYRHVIEDISRNSTLNEWEISLQAIALAREQSAHADEKISHVGYYLIDRGSSLLRERSVPKRPRIMAWRRFIQSFRLQLYFLGLAVLTFSLCFGLLAYLWPALSDRLTVYMLGIILLLGFSQVALSLINWLTILLCKPHILPRMDFSRGIPPEFRSLVVIPSMLINRRNIENLLESIEVHYLANRDENLHFALLTDFADSNQQSCPEDKELLEQVQHGILALNAKYPKQTNEIFCLFHRNRSWNDLDKIWMGHERKRGKLEALNAYLRKVNHEPFFSLTIENLAYIKFVITLDTDTQMPRDAARKMIATLAHPLNQAHFDPKLGRVSEGYGILQPRIAYNLPSSRRSRFVRIYARNAGLDPYTRLVSDVYQDLFFEGSFCGKGIYDIDAVNSSLLNKLPNNLILSHDLIEGCYARSGLVSDVELFEDFPFHYGEDIARRSRWIRGDWQIIAWLFSNPPSLKEKSQKNPLSQLSKWKIFDNLRRSLVPMSILIALFLSWTIFDSIEYSIFLTAAVLSMIFLPALLATLTEAARKPAEISLRSHLCTLISSSISHLTQATLAIAFLPFEAFINFNALIRSCLRMFITHKHLLEWKSACNPLHSTHSEFSKFYRNMLVAPFIAFIGLIGLYFWRTQNLIIALPFLMLWFLSPLIAHWISRPTPAVIQRLTRHQTQSLHRISRKTWRFFETFVGPDENWLPPDNFQEYPISVLAHRTSPTNMGLSLLANLAAYDFGYLSAEALIERCSHSLTT